MGKTWDQEARGIAQWETTSSTGVALGSVSSEVCVWVAMIKLGLTEKLILKLLSHEPGIEMSPLIPALGRQRQADLCEF